MILYSLISNNGVNMLQEPVMVARVLMTPTVNVTDDFLLMTASRELRVKGTGLIGAEKVDLYFQPTLTKDVVYEDVSKYPLVKNEVVLRLRHGYSWRETPGPLVVTAIDTGGGIVYAGAKVAYVRDNHDPHAVQVDDTSETQFLYADEPNLVIKGTGFNPIGNLLRFSNGLLGNNVNYTTVSTTETSITLQLVSGSFWRKHYPGTLTLLAVNAGAGYIATSKNDYGGREVAMIFERPDVHFSAVKIHRTQSNSLYVSGKGFPELKSGYKPSLRFSPALTEGIDYTTRVIDRTDLELTLLDRRSWRTSAGPLIISAINTRGDANGWVDLPGEGVHVAEVVEDIDASATRLHHHHHREEVSESIANHQHHRRNDDNIIRSKRGGGKYHKKGRSNKVRYDSYSVPSRSGDGRRRRRHGNGNNNMMLHQRDDYDAAPVGHSRKDDGSIQQMQRNSHKMKKIVRKLEKIHCKIIRLEKIHHNRDRMEKIHHHDIGLEKIHHNRNRLEKIHRTCEFNKIHTNNQMYPDKVNYSDNNTLNHHDHHHHEQRRNETADGNQTCDGGRRGGGTTGSEKKDNLKALQSWKDLLLTLRWMLLMMMLMTAMLTIPVMVVIAMITTMLQRIQK
jgi:hypothetical protein